MTRLSSERKVVQNPIINYAEEVGWTYLKPEEALRLRRGETSPILWEVFTNRYRRSTPAQWTT